MTPKEKAHELIVKALVQFEKLTINEAKKIALIAVHEILDVDCFDMSQKHFENHIDYWKEVKYEIKKL